MSTKAIREALDRVQCTCADHSCVGCRAQLEVEAIERAAKAWWTRDDVMERIEDAGHGGFEVVQAIAKDAP